MAKRKASVGSEIVEGLTRAVAFAKGEEAKVRTVVVRRGAPLDVRGVREKLGMSQDAFADRFGISAATLRNWEQGRREPHGPARVLLTVIDREPQAVQRALGD